MENEQHEEICAECSQCRKGISVHELDHFKAPLRHVLYQSWGEDRECDSEGPRSAQSSFEYLQNELLVSVGGTGESRTGRAGRDLPLQTGLGPERLRSEERVAL